MREPFIRPAAVTDTPAIHALIASVYAEYGCLLDVESDERHLNDPGPFFRAGGGEFWVVTLADRLVATGAVFLHPDSAELKTLYVHPEMRRKGLARRLIDLAMNHAVTYGRDRMILWTDTRFVNAHRLYESLGFRRSGYRELNDLNRSREYQYEMGLNGIRKWGDRSNAKKMSDGISSDAAVEHAEFTHNDRSLPMVGCEACGAQIPLEHQKPKPYCRRCGWVLSCCNPE